MRRRAASPPLLVIFQNGVNHTQPRSQLGPLDRPLSLVAFHAALRRFPLTPRLEDLPCLSRLRAMRLSTEKFCAAWPPRLKVSCDGMPEGSVKNVCNHSSLSASYSAMSFQLSAPLNTAAIAISKISSSRYSRFRSTRGSRNSGKCFRGFSISPCRPSTPPRRMAIYLRRPW